MVNDPNRYTPNPYACLGLMPGNSEADIKRRYRQLAKQYHPDRNGHSAESGEKLRDLNAAYAFLSDPARKAAYDAFAAAVFHPVRVPQPAPSAPYVPRSRSRRAAVSLTLLLLLSTGAGVLFSAANSSPVLSGLLTRMSGKSTGPDRPAPPYSFLPSKGTFDDESSPSAPSSPAPSETAPPQ